MVKKEAIGDRGKSAEKAVKDVLDRWNGNLHFAYFRLADARAARGRLTAQPGDFVFFAGSTAGIIEVKSTEHSSRIAKDKISQLPVLHKLHEAGAKSLIVIHHSVLDQWRAVPAHYLELGKTSWLLDDYPLFDTPAEAMKSLGWF